MYARGISLVERGCSRSPNVVEDKLIIKQPRLCGQLRSTSLVTWVPFKHYHPISSHFPVNPAETPVSHGAHLGGGVTGALLGLAILQNLKKRFYEGILWKIALGKRLGNLKEVLQLQVESNWVGLVFVWLLVFLFFIGLILLTSPSL